MFPASGQRWPCKYPRPFCWYSQAKGPFHHGFIITFVYVRTLPNATPVKYKLGETRELCCLKLRRLGLSASNNNIVHVWHIWVKFCSPFPLGFCVIMWTYLAVWPIQLFNSDKDVNDFLLHILRCISSHNLHAFICFNLRVAHSA